MLLLSGRGLILAHGLRVCSPSWQRRHSGGTVGVSYLLLLQGIRSRKWGRARPSYNSQALPPHLFHIVPGTQRLQDLLKQHQPWARAQAHELCGGRFRSIHRRVCHEVRHGGAWKRSTRKVVATCISPSPHVHLSPWSFYMG